MHSTARDRPGARGLRVGIAVGAFVFLVCHDGRSATPAGTVVSNQASVALVTPSGARATIYSNVDRFAIAAASTGPTTSQVGLFRIDASSPDRINIDAAAFHLGGESGPLLALAWPAGLTQDADGSVTVGLRAAQSFRSGEAILVRVVDPDQNHDPMERESITVRVTNAGTSEIETVDLRETGPNTGSFGGFVWAEPMEPGAYDGHFAVIPDSALFAHYNDVGDATDKSDSGALIDPFGMLFDSATGEPISGVAVTILDALTGQPAVVHGSDGASTFPSSIVTGVPVQDSSGRRYSLGPGRFVFPLVAPGNYRYQVALPERAGFTFPSVASDAALDALPGAPFALDSGSRGAAFAVVLDPVETDIPLDPRGGSLVLNLRAGVTSAGFGDFVEYTLEASNQRAFQAFTNVVIDDTLPVGFRLEPSSVRLHEVPVPVTVAPDGRTFTLTVPQIPAGQTARISYVTRVAAPRPGRAMNRAGAAAGLLRSNEATAAVTIQDDLMSTGSHILGRVASFQEGRATDGGLAGVAVYLETGTMTVTDARGFFRLEGVTPGTHVVQLDTTTLPRGAGAVLPHDSAPAADRGWSRFVDLAPGTVWNVEFAVEISSVEGALSRGPAGTDNILSANNAVSPADSRTASPVYNQEWLDAEPDTQNWVLPLDGDSFPMPAMKILVKHHPAHKVSAWLNGQPVNAINFDGIISNKSKTLVASLWSGVNLIEGDNVIEIVRTDSFGNERGRAKRIVHFASPPVRAEFVASESTLLADGVTPPVLAVRLFDRDNHPARAGVTARVRVREPYAVFHDDTANIRLLPGAAPETDAFVVSEGGLAHIRLMPTTMSGTVYFTLALVTGEHEFRADLRSDRKEWILVGLAEGTSAYQTIHGNMETARADEVGPDGWGAGSRVAFFAKGRIRGGWLLTAAYDSEKKRRAPRSLHGKIDPDAYYTVYGDQSGRLESAPSSRKLYVKLEREAVSALFGDFTLDWTSTAFTTYARDLHGAAVDYRGQHIRASAFQSDAGLKFTRDEIRGNGLSGPYQLLRQNIVPFSEKVAIEERDTLRPDIVTSENPLHRDIDYTIDYFAGTVRLSAPLFASSTALRPQFLVVRYEMEDDTAGVVTGGRIEFLPTDKVVVGAAHVAEEHDGETGTVSGLDARVALTAHVTLQAEAARSDTAAGTANAYRAEASHRSEASDTRVYFREVGAGFGLGQLNSAQTGNRQIGVEGSQRLTRKLATRELVYRETVLGTGDQREAGEVQIEVTEGDWSLRGGVKAARDQRNGGEVEESLLATAGISRRLAGERLELRADREQSISGEAENLDFPARTIVGATYAFSKSTSLRAEHEWTEAKDRETSQSRIGIESAPWTGGTVTGAVMQSYGGTPGTLLGGGLKQTVQLTPALGVEGGFERSNVISGGADTDPVTGAPAASRTPFHSTSGFGSVAQGNAVSGFAGVHWKPSEILYNARAEVSDTDLARRVGFLASAQAEPGRDLGVVASVIAFQQTSDTARAMTHVDARFGAAWRPAAGSTIALQRFDVVHSPSGDSQAWKLIENFHLNQKIGDDLQVSLHVGAKYSWQSLPGAEYSGFTTISAFEVRRALGPKWDVGVHGALLSAWSASTRRPSFGLSLGRSLARNVWASVGYNFAGFRDADFSAGRYSSPGFFLKFRIRFDQESLAGLLRTIKEE